MFFKYPYIPKISVGDCEKNLDPKKYFHDISSVRFFENSTLIWKLKHTRNKHSMRLSGLVDC